VRFRHIRRGGPHYRVADPDWRRPLEGRYAKERGGRWNAPGSFPIVYLFSTVELARSFALHKHRGLPYSVLDMAPDRFPVLVQTQVPEQAHVDVVTNRGCVAATLPPTYPLDEHGTEVPWDRCRPIGQAAWGQGEPGIACRSASARPGDAGEELAWFQRETRLRSSGRQRFDEWFGVGRPTQT
jgi:RES domain-containing protein